MSGEYVQALLGILISAILSENYILVKFYGDDSERATTLNVACRAKEAFGLL